MNPSNEKPPSENNRNTRESGLGDNPWRAMGLVGTVGADLAVCLGAGVWLGTRADAAYGTNHWYMVGMLAGLAVGVVTIYFLIRAFTGGKGK